MWSAESLDQWNVHQGFFVAKSDQHLPHDDGCKASSQPRSADSCTTGKTAILVKPLRGERHEQWNCEPDSRTLYQTDSEQDVPYFCSECRTEETDPGDGRREVKDTFEAESITHPASKEGTARHAQGRGCKCRRDVHGGFVCKHGLAAVLFCQSIVRIVRARSGDQERTARITPIVIPCCISV